MNARHFLINVGISSIFLCFDIYCAFSIYIIDLILFFLLLLLSFFFPSIALLKLLTCIDQAKFCMSPNKNP